MLYEMLTGRTPFSGPSPLAVMNDRLMNHPFPLRKADPGISPHLEEVLYRALEREPKDRYRSAHDFAWDLEHLDQVGVSNRQELTEWKKPRTTARGNALIYTLLALIPILALLAVLFFTRHHN
jgi:serine/threonine-protein kinase